MLPYEKLVLSVFKDGEYQPDVYKKLQQADNRVIRALTKVLRSSPDPLIRECCAELLREHGSARAVPDLIQVLHDESWHVRFDAMWAIEELCHFDSGGLRDWLDVEPDQPHKLKARVKAWWKLNRRFIENNPLLPW